MKFRFTQMLWPYLNASSVNGFTLWRPNTKLNWKPNAFTDICLSGHRMERMFSTCTGPTQEWSHSAQACNNPLSWGDTSSIVRSEAGAHAENLFTFMVISITEVYTLCSKDTVKSVLHWLQKAALTAQCVVAICVTANIMWFIGSSGIWRSEDHLEVLFLLRLLVLSKPMMNSGYFSTAIIKPKHIFSYCLLPDFILYLEASSDGFGLAIMILS